MKYAVVGEVWSTLGKKLNQAFTGNAEALMKAVLNGAGINVKAVYFTNAVSTPVDKVLKGHVDKCQDALFAELKAQQPKVILACGSWAAYALLGKQTPITALRGYPFWSIELQAYVVPTLHPSAVTYNPAYFEDFAHDVAKLKDVAKLEPGGVKHEEPNLVVVESYEQWMEMWPHIVIDDCVMSVDIETDGFEYFKDDILSIGCGINPTDVIIFNRECVSDPRMREPLEKFLGHKEVAYVYQNGKFDVQYMRAEGDPAIFGKVKNCVVSTARCDFDTMLAHYCIDERQGTHGLKLWARGEFDAPDWEADLGKYLPTKDTPYSAIPPEVLHKYQAYDVFYTRKGYYRFIEKMKEEGTYECFQQVYVPAVEAFTQLELEGIPVDLHRLKELYDEAQPRIAEAAKALEQAAIDAGWSPTEYAKMKNAEKMFKWTRRTHTCLKRSRPSVLAVLRSRKCSTRSRILSCRGLRMTCVACRCSKVLRRATRMQLTCTDTDIPSGKPWPTTKRSVTCSERSSRACWSVLTLTIASDLTSCCTEPRPDASAVPTRTCRTCLVALS